ncbi:MULTISPECIES: NemA protein [Eikenella]|uniref:NemA protein n=1 Tax=Eikenella longinqua TaxID=1795827 RepID=A0A1A9RYB4_9NEIS|nr:MULTISPECIES: NemA protein [Eikenella]OAM27753.1 NemA protein [Eikenella longinqua]
MEKRHLAACVCAAWLLAGCTGSDVMLGLGFGGRHFGMGTGLSIPVGSRRNVQDLRDLRIIEEQVLTYFDAEGRPSNAAVKGGYYRQLLSRQGGGYLVQDFYETGQKRSDAMLLARDALYNFRAHPQNGVLTTYAINGNILYQQNFRDGKMVSASY